MAKEGCRYEQSVNWSSRNCLMPRAQCMCLHHPLIEIGVPVRVSSFCRIYHALIFSHYQLRIIAPF